MELARADGRSLVLGDMLLVVLALLHGAALIAAPSLALIAVGVWWNSNTIAHNFVHHGFFESKALRRSFSAYLSVLLGIPQTLWRDRHLAHHAGSAFRLRWSAQLAIEAGLILSLWASLLYVDAAFFLGTYLPGYGLGLVLCAVQGHYEHAAGTTSHYGRLYNVLCFNDGFHGEHHARPGVHWTRLRKHQARGVTVSRWPPLLRWLDAIALDTLERVVVRSPLLQRFMMATHRRAFAKLLATIPPPNRIAVVGGALFPRTALILRSLRPDALIVVIDESATNIGVARSFLGEGIEQRCCRFPSPDMSLDDMDLVVIPLAFRGDRLALYRDPPAAALLSHDWLWHSRGTTAVISLLLLKRLNLVRR